MRPALRRLLGSPSALPVLRNAIESSDRCQSCWSWRATSTESTGYSHRSISFVPETLERDPVEENTMAGKLRFTRDPQKSGKIRYCGGESKFSRKIRYCDGVPKPSRSESEYRPDNVEGKENLERRLGLGKGWRRPLVIEAPQHEKSPNSYKSDTQNQDLPSIPALAGKPPSTRPSAASDIVGHRPPRFKSTVNEPNNQNLDTHRLDTRATAKQTSVNSPAQLSIVSPDAQSKARLHSRGAIWTNVLMSEDLHTQLDLWVLDCEDAVILDNHPHAPFNTGTVTWENEVADQKAEAGLDPMTGKEGTPIHQVSAQNILGLQAFTQSRAMAMNQYEYDSVVHLPVSQETYLKDDNSTTPDFEPLLQAVLRQRRRAGTQGLRALWKYITACDFELPTKGAKADQLWGNLVQMGIDSDVLPSVIRYATILRQKTNSYWRDLYYDIIRSQIARDSPKTLKYHKKLYKKFPPTVEQFMSLFDLVHKRTRLSFSRMQKLMRIYVDLPFRNLYADIITRLYENEDFSGAASWHGIMIMKKDVPADLYLYRPLFRYMVLHGDRKLLAAMVEMMVEARISLPNFITYPLPISPASQKLIDQRLAEIHGIKPLTVDDGFCARLFATTWFSIGTVIKILRILGVDTLGACSLREVLVRDSAIPESVLASLAHIRSNGISLDSSTYCSLVKRLALADNARLLENVSQCDLHPETFEDKALQESLLFEYYNNGDQLQVDRTLAILTAKCTDKSQPTVYWNVHLRLQLKQKDIKAVNHTLELMHASQIHIESASSAYVRICLLTRRSIGKRPHFTHDLPIITNIWQNVLRSGGVVPSIAWKEVLRRLGMTGQLDEYEKLALWLAKYYSGSSAGPSLGLLPGHQVVSVQLARRLTYVPSRLSSGELSHPLHVLFPPNVQQAIVAWGFQHARIGGANWRWGLQLLLKLKLFRVFIKRSTVARACRLRLANIFGTGRSSKTINRRTEAQNAHALGFYVREIEKIGGLSLFFGPVSRNHEAKRIGLLREEFLHWETRSARRTRALRGVVRPVSRSLPLNSANLGLHPMDPRSSKFDME